MNKDIGKDLQNAYDEGYKQGRYDEKVETETIIFKEIPKEEKNPRFTGQCYSTTVTKDVYDAIKDIANRTGKSRKEVATILFDFALEHVEWE